MDIKHYFSKKTAFLFFSGLIAIEIISFFIWRFPFFSQGILFFIGVLFLILTKKKFSLAAVILFLELILGSKGHLLPELRIELFIIFFFVGGWKLVQERKWFLFSENKKLFFSFAIFILFIIIGVFQGIQENNMQNVFFDVNGYFYFALLPLFYTVFSQEKNYSLLINAFLAGIFVLFLKTYFLFFIFSHGIFFLTPTFYEWVRDTNVAEPTFLRDGLYRIFFQSHIFALFGFFIFFILTFFEKNKKKYLFLCVFGAMSLSMVFISFSRSFWAVTAIFFLFLFFLWGIFFRNRMIFDAGKNFFLITLLSIILVVGNLALPVQKFLPSGIFLSGDLIKERLKNLREEDAAKSRWTQLPPLLAEIQKKPILGHGFGKSITYQSSDPRILEKNPEGWYTTFAFEWGYLDILLKSGIFGLLSFLFFLSILLWNLFKQIQQKKEFAMISFLGITGVLLVVFVHIFTPYLNHPLGIGIIILAYGISGLNKEELETRVSYDTHG